MKNINEFKLIIESKGVNEAFSRAVVSAFVSPADPTIEELTDIKTAVSEAVTNSIVHGYKNSLGNVYIEGSIDENNVVKIKIKDKGVGIEDVKLAMQPLYTSGDDNRAGLRFTVMQSFCDRVKVSSSLNKGTTVTLTKKIKGKAL